MKKICLTVLLLFVALMSAVQAQTPQETLNQYISDLQKNPNDNALREKIIKHVQTMELKPVMPEEAKKYINRGMAAAEDAKNDKDYKDAADEFQKAVNLAPWLGAGYRGLAVVQDKAGQYSQALQNLKFFLLTNPPSADAEAAKTLRDKIEYRQEKAAKESSPVVIAEKKQSDFEDLLKKIESARFTRTVLGDDGGKWIMVLDIKNSSIVSSTINPQGIFRKDVLPVVNIRNLESSITFKNPATGENETHTFLINGKGDKITQRIRFSDGEVREFTYTRER